MTLASAIIKVLYLLQATQKTKSNSDALFKDYLMAYMKKIFLLCLSIKES